MQAKGRNMLMYNGMSYYYKGREKNAIDTRLVGYLSCPDVKTTHMGFMCNVQYSQIDLHTTLRHDTSFKLL